MIRPLLLIIIVFSIVTSCNREKLPGCSLKGIVNGSDPRLHITNLSADTLTLIWELNTSDTTLYAYMSPPYFGVESYVIDPGERQKWPHRDCWDYAFERSPVGKLNFYLFDLPTLRSTSWEEIVSEKKYLKLYTFTLQEIKDINWQIVYEP